MTLSSILPRSFLLVAVLLLAACGPVTAPIVVTAADVPQNAPLETSAQAAEQK
jgi:uncharacterized lipoprotein YajG